MPCFFGLKSEWEKMDDNIGDDNIEILVPCVIITDDRVIRCRNFLFYSVYLTAIFPFCLSQKISLSVPL